MRAEELLRIVMREGEVVRSSEVSGATYPNAARTYLADGTGVAWVVPEQHWNAGVFAVDAEIPVGVRPVLSRRYGIDDPAAFARAWTRAEALAKLDDLPIVTWLARHRLDVPPRIERERTVGEIAWETVESRDMVLTFAVRLTAPLLAGGAHQVGPGVSPVPERSPSGTAVRELLDVVRGADVPRLSGATSSLGREREQPDRMRSCG